MVHKCISLYFHQKNSIGKDRDTGRAPCGDRGAVVLQLQGKEDKDGWRLSRDQQLSKTLTRLTKTLKGGKILLTPWSCLLT